MSSVVLGLGSNCGDRAAHLRRAIRSLRLLRLEGQTRVQSVSRLYESDALLPENAPHSWNRPYLNLGLSIETTVEPPVLLAQMKELEQRLGRRDRGRWAPREIDIDLLTWGNLCMRSEVLTLPHSGLVHRPFVLLPLREVAPDWVHPEMGRTAADLAIEYADSGGRISGSPRVRVRVSAEMLTQWVGILNVTPDSFSDGGRYVSPKRALERAAELLDEGASVLDIGAESTRPGAQPLDPREEWARLERVLEPITRMSAERAGETRERPIVSVDTRNPETAARAISAGVEWINDVTGGSDPRMASVVGPSGATLVFMHSVAVPPEAGKTLPADVDAIESVMCWAREWMTALTSAGIPADRLIFDPGIGFGKTPEQNVRLLGGVAELRDLGLPLLVGHSRKSFIRRLGLGEGAAPEGRDLESAVISAHLADAGTDYVRVHRVDWSRRAAAISRWMGQGGS